MNFDNCCRVALQGRDFCVWRESAKHPDYLSYYCESRAYMVKRRDSEVVTLVYADSPDEAIEKVIADGIPPSVKDALNDALGCEWEVLAAEHGTESGDDPQFDKLLCLISNLQMKLKGKV